MNSAILSHSVTGRGRLWPVSGPFSLDDESAYARWREAKLADYPRAVGELLVSFADLARPTAEERAAVIALCARANMAVYRASELGRDAAAVRPALRALGEALGLRAVEDHRSAEADGIVAIEVVEGGGRLGYIPYTTRAISWHTDGYYNYHGASNSVQAMLLHCVRDAAEGGVNALLDHEIAYIRLRDRDPALIAALMHPQTMTIPEGEEAHGRVRPDNTGPVFFIEPSRGALVMRYTARKRYISWRDEAVTRAAVAALEEVLESDPLILRHTMQPGEGLICNNVLHTRTGFTNGEGAGRLLYRVRYHDRVCD
jgi:alpha-ketoglutarate-dependent taurine dioxygenase